MSPKKLLLPALLPVVLLLLLSAWVYYTEVTGTVRMINGRPDDAPLRASVIVASLSPLTYMVFAVFNLIDTTLDRFSVKAAWIGTALLTGALGIFFSRGLYAPEVDSTPYFSIAVGFGCSILIFVPMALIRRFVIRSRP